MMKNTGNILTEAIENQCSIVDHLIIEDYFKITAPVPAQRMDSSDDYPIIEDYFVPKLFQKPTFIGSKNTTGITQEQQLQESTNDTPPVDTLYELETQLTVLKKHSFELSNIPKSESIVLNHINAGILGKISEVESRIASMAAIINEEQNVPVTYKAKKPTLAALMHKVSLPIPIIQAKKPAIGSNLQIAFSLADSKPKNRNLFFSTQRHSQSSTNHSKHKVSPDNSLISEHNGSTPYLALLGF